VVAIGTAVRRADDMRPQTPQLIPQAVIYDKSSANSGASIQALGPLVSPMPVAQAQLARAGGGAIGLIVLFVIMGGTCALGILASVLQVLATR
jgi:hypothetical protein